MTSPTDRPDDGWVAPNSNGSAAHEDAPSSWGPAPSLPPQPDQAPATPSQVDAAAGTVPPSAPDDTQPSGSPQGYVQPPQESPQSYPAQDLPLQGMPPQGSPQGPSPQYPPGYGQPAAAQGYPQGFPQGGEYGQRYAPYTQGQPVFVAPPKPGIVPLRPLSLGDILDGAFRAIRFNPKVMFLVPLVVLAIAAAAQAVLSYVAYDRMGFSGLFDPSSYTSSSSYGFDASGQTQQDLGTALIATVLLYLVMAFAGLLATGILTFAVSDAVVGTKSSFASIWQRLRPRLWPLIGVTALTMLIMALIVAVLLAGPIAATTQADIGLLIVSWLLGILVVAIAIVFVAIRFAFTTQAVALEGSGPLGALSRSWRLVTGSFWRTFGILALTTIILGIAAAIIAFPVQLIFTLATISAPQTSMWLVVLSSTIATLIQSVITVPFFAAVTTLLYVDIRIRREGLDVQLTKAAAAS